MIASIDPGGGNDPDDRPVIVDLCGEGMKIAPLSSWNKMFDMAGDGHAHSTAQAGRWQWSLVA
jgi:hypothetical protein